MNDTTLAPEPPTMESPQAGNSSTKDAAHSVAGATLPTLVSDVYRAAPAPLRAKLLECLLRPVGPLALAVIASGAFGAFLQRRTWSPVSLSLDEVARISGDHLFELAGYLEQSSPEVFLQMPGLLASSPLGLAAGSGALVLALRRCIQARQRDWTTGR
jgi:hypothetical protein